MNKVFIDALTVVITGVIIGLMAAGVISILFVMVTWSLAQFGVAISFLQFIAGIVLLVVFRAVLSYLYVKGK